MFSEIIFWLSYLIVFIFLLIFGYSLILSFLLRIPFIPSKTSTIKKMIDLANPSQNDIIYDLGCGDMKILLQMEKSKNLSGTGFEISPLPYVIGKLKLIIRNSKNQIKFQNILKVNFSDANILFIYLTPPILKKIAPKLLKECTKGTKIISNTFQIPNLSPQKTLNQDSHSQKIFFYEIK